MEDKPQRLVTTREAAEQLGIAERTVLLWLGQGRLHGRREGKSWRIDAASVDAMAARTGHAETRRPHVPAAPAASPPGASEEQRARTARPDRARRDYSFRDLSALATLADLAALVQKARCSAGDAAPGAAWAAALDAAIAAAQFGAAGYHAWAAPDKLRLYAQARERAAMAACGLWIVADSSEGRAEGLRLVATQLERTASTLGGLMRRAGRHAT